MNPRQWSSVEQSSLKSSKVMQFGIERDISPEIIIFYLTFARDHEENVDKRLLRGVDRSSWYLTGKGVYLLSPVIINKVPFSRLARNEWGLICTLLGTISNKRFRRRHIHSLECCNYFVTKKIVVIIIIKWTQNAILVTLNNNVFTIVDMGYI